MELTGNTVLVTGATGFIGGRLVEKLTLEKNAHVRALVRNFRSASWLSRTCAEIIPGDLNDAQAVSQAVQGCSAVFHCAADVSQDYASSYRVNVDGTRNLLEAAQESSVERFLHVSSVAVHADPPAGQAVTEETPFITDKTNVYACTKLLGEQIAAGFAHDHPLHVTILRPTIVFGPRASLWTVDYAVRLLKDQIALSPSIRGKQNFVYVDDVIQALLLAAEASIPGGEAFIIGAEHSLTWPEYLGLYAAIVGKPLQQWPLGLLKSSAIIFGILDQNIERLRAHPRPWKAPIIFGMRGTRRVLRPFRRINTWELGFYQEQHEYKIDKAMRMLGFQPAKDTQPILNDIAVWLKAQGYLPSPEHLEAYGS